MNARLREYLLASLFGQIFIVLTLTPWLLWIVNMPLDVYLTWLWQGSLIGLVLPYGMLRWIRFWIEKIDRKKH